MIARRRCYFRGRVLKSRQLKSARNMPRSDDRKSKGPGLALLEYLFRLDREAQRNFGRSVENLEQMATDQAMELALGPRFRGQFNATVAGAAFGTDDVGFSHGRKDSIAISVVLRRPLAFPVRNASSRSLIRIKLGHRRIGTSQKRELSVYLTRRSVRINPRRRPVPGWWMRPPDLPTSGGHGLSSNS